MANITVTLTNKNRLEVSFIAKQGLHVRVASDQTDWMLQMDDFRDLITPLNESDTDWIIQELLNNANRISFSMAPHGQEYSLLNGKKVVRRLVKGQQRNEYQSVALFAPNKNNVSPPPPIELDRHELLQLIRAMITLDAPADHFIKDSLRNLQYILAILWLKKTNPALLAGTKKLNAKEIFRVSLEQ